MEKYQEGGHNLNEDEVEKELGDVLWCLMALA
ncbi:MazG nucleotide pyrophosphohydrolase domain-containing protein [Bacillus cereus]|nr:MazG nucleotide pyrophosphohydrolase domain-containing protein [Bacillus thuringiensis]MEB9423131.1 MazG nucleotide pyrophosphohydrolase domain-containing protein [Bacillus cereus]